MAEAWVVDTSPLIILSHAQALELLPRLADRLIVPSAVVEEILAGPEDPAVRAVQGGFGERVAASADPNVAEWGLGRGEGAVLSIAAALHATAVVDDGAARRCAASLGVRTIGTLGVIARAARTGLVPAAGPLVRRAIEAGMYCDDATIRTLLLGLGEHWP